MAKSIVIAGLGPHVRHDYYPFLENLSRRTPLRLRLVIDLEDQAQIVSEFLEGRSLHPERIVLIDPRLRAAQTLPEALSATLGDLHRQAPIDAMLVATEPKGHKAYLVWALENGIDVAVEKPMTAPPLDTRDPRSAERILADFLEIESLMEHSASRAVALIHRRRHPGYRFVRDYLSDFIDEFGVPITHLETYHADGTWNMPSEFRRRENHPYKYGYGKLMHSGYHHLDLFMWLMELNQRLPEKRPERLELTTRHVTPYDFLHQVGEDQYRRLLGNSDQGASFSPAILESLRHSGETDVTLLGHFKRGDAVMTTAVASLLQTSCSRRSWPDLRDPVFNKETGRMTHERVTLQVGHLLNLQCRCEALPREMDDTDGRPGPPKPFKVRIVRNQALVGGPAVEREVFREEAIYEREGRSCRNTLARRAREDLFTAWLTGEDSGSELQRQRRSTELMARVYECLFRQNCGQAPTAVMPL